MILYDSARTPLSSVVPGGTLGGKLAAFAQRTEVGGTLVDVGVDPRVIALRAQAALAINVPCPYAKNLVAGEIKSIVDAYLAGNPLQYIVIVGNDSLWLLAWGEYHDVKKWKVIAEHNDLDDPRDIAPGDWMTIPPLEQDNGSRRRV